MLKIPIIYERPVESLRVLMDIASHPGQAYVGEISGRTGIPRTIVYNVLYFYEEKRVVEKSPKVVLGKEVNLYSLTGKFGRTMVNLEMDKVLKQVRKAARSARLPAIEVNSPEENQVF